MATKTTKKKTTKKTTPKPEPKPGEQLQLIDVGPANLKKIKPLVSAYKDAQATRIAALQDEVKYKQRILEEAHKAKLNRLPDGKIRFTCDGFLVEITPRDEVIKIKDQTSKE